MRKTGFTEEILDDLIGQPALLRDFLGYYRIVRGEPQTEDSQMSLLKEDIRGLNLSVRTVNSLSNFGIRKVFELVQRSHEEIYMVKNLGRKSLQEIGEFLVSRGLNLSMKLEMKDGLPVRVLHVGTPPVLLG